MLEKEGYPTPVVFQKACESRNYRILAYLIKFCKEKKEKIENESNYMIMVNLKNEPKEFHGPKYGVYTMDSEEVNGRPSWSMGEQAYLIQEWSYTAKIFIVKNTDIHYVHFPTAILMHFEQSFDGHRGSL